MFKTMNKKITLVLLLMLTAVSGLVLFVSPVSAAEESIFVSWDDGVIQISNGDTLNFTNEDGELTIFNISNNTSIHINIESGFSKDSIVTGSGTFTIPWDDGVIQISNGDTLNFNNEDGELTIFNISNNTSIHINIESGFSENVLVGVFLDVSPIISGETTFATDVDERRDLSYFMQWIKAYDETDGDITSSIVVETDNYTANKAVLGTHAVTISVSDSSGNKTTAVINIYVADVTKPVISGSTATATIGYKETWNIANFKASLTVTDNYDTLTHSNITVKTDGYTANKAKLGTYNVVYAVSDSSGNEGLFTKQVKVIDNVKPVFDGPLTIATSNTTIMTESDVRARLTASDEIDGNLTSKITLVEDNYSGKGNKVGSYTIKYSVTDNAGNIAEHTVTINRIDSMPPTLWVENGKTIRVPQGTAITRQQIIDILEATKVIQVNAMTTFTFPVDEYTGNEEIPGAYLMSILSRSTNGNEDIHNVTIQVLADTDSPDDSITKGDDKTWIQKNGLYVGIGAVALIGLAVLFLNRKRK